MGRMTITGIAKAAVAGAFIAFPALALPAIAHAAPTEITCVARTATTCYYLIPASAQGSNDVPTVPSSNPWDDEGSGDTGGGGGAAGGGG